jgi:hypothetical protein
VEIGICDSHIWLALIDRGFAGANSGIGMCAAKQIAQKGYRCFLCVAALIKGLPPKRRLLVKRKNKK